MLLNFRRTDRNELYTQNVKAIKAIASFQFSKSFLKEQTISSGISKSKGKAGEISRMYFFNISNHWTYIVPTTQAFYFSGFDLIITE